MNALDRALPDNTIIAFHAKNPQALQRYLYLLNKYRGQIPEYLMDHIKESPEFGKVPFMSDKSLKKWLDEDLDLYLTETDMDNMFL